MNQILAFDTSGPWCAAALLRGTDVIAAIREDMTRGQAERLMPLLEEMLKDHNCDWANLTRIGVGIGPGNFTGIRIAVSAARGLALGLAIPAIGVSGFDALRRGSHGTAVLPAPREMAYVQVDDGPAEQIVDGDIPQGAVTLHTETNLAIAIAELAATRSPGPAPAPLYLRAADAAPPRDAPLVMLDDA